MRGNSYLACLLHMTPSCVQVRFLLPFILPIVTWADVATVGFEGPPVQPANTHFATAQYDEAGYHFQPFGDLATVPPYRMGRVGPDTTNRPNNGTTHLVLLVGDSCKITRADGAHFDALQIDLAEYSTVFASPQTTVFTGRKAGGGTVTVSFTTDGVIDGTGSQVDFQTFTFPDTFRDLVSLETDDILAYDNLVLNRIVAPVPSSPTLPVQAPVTITGMLSTERSPITTGTIITAKPLVRRFGNSELLAFLTDHDVITSAEGWRLVCSYEAILTNYTPGALHLEVVHTDGRRINIDDYFSIEALAQSAEISLKTSAKDPAGQGKITESRFCKLSLSGVADTTVTFHGRLDLSLTVRRAGEGIAGVGLPVKAVFSGHADAFTVAELTLRLGAFSPVAP